MTPPNPTILIVEDEAKMRRLLELDLGDDGFRTLSAEDAESGLKLLQSHAVDLVITDLKLPGMNGLELCERLRSLPGGEDAVLLVMTGYGSPRSIPAILAAGASDYLQKPFDLDTLELRLAVAESRAIEAARRLAMQGGSTEPGVPGEDVPE